MASLIRRSVQAALSVNTSQMESMLARLQSLEQDRPGQPAQPPPPPQPLRAVDCPPCTISNPWKHCHHLLIVQDRIIGEAFGTHLLSDCEFFPGLEAYPECYVRLRGEAPPLETPKEVVLLEVQRAQDFVVGEARAAGYSESSSTPAGGKFPSYLAPSDMTFPFASKALSSVLGACSKGDTPPPLEEFLQPSFLLPTTQPDWEDVEATFSAKSLAADTAIKQLRSTLPHLCLWLIEKEAKARELLASSLSHQFLLETLAARNPRDISYPVLSKSHLPSLHARLTDFVLARRECRKYVLRHAQAREEPQRLINSSCWGKDLFPDRLVREILESVVRRKDNLMDRWEARPTTRGDTRSQERGDAPQERGRGRGRRRHPRRNRDPHHPSPAHNPRFEREGRQGPSHGDRDRRTGGGGSRDVRSGGRGRGWHRGPRGGPRSPTRH